MIEINNICKSFEGRDVLKDISAVFEKGKTNLIIGQSGSGKTVLLKSIVGLFDIECGEILFDGRNVRTMNFREQKSLRQEIGMVFQNGALFDSLTVEENVRFPMDMFTNMSMKEKVSRLNFCLERVNIKESNHLYPSEISGGMRKRVGEANRVTHLSTLS
jgi:phospholipid/cholesterol/gamma-HCH transport system ATP-binding protein